LINSGRLSTPTLMPQSSLNTPDTAAFAGSQQLGMPALDAPLGETWLLKLLSNDFTLVTYDTASEIEGMHCLNITAAQDQQGWFAKRFDAKPGSAYLFRPDQHLCARWRSVDPAAIQAAKTKALGQT
jgi:3-(3-hydroxy-phenyl)propionate hydroxylase